MAADDPALSKAAPLIGQEHLEELTLGSARVAVEGQVRLDRTHTDIGHEGDHVRDRASDHAELRTRLIERPGTALDLDDELSRDRNRSLGHPASESPRPDRPERKARQREVMLPTLLGQEKSRRTSPQNHRVLTAASRRQPTAITHHPKVPPGTVTQLRELQCDPGSEQLPDRGQGRRLSPRMATHRAGTATKTRTPHLPETSPGNPSRTPVTRIAPLHLVNPIVTATAT